MEFIPLTQFHPGTDTTFIEGMYVGSKVDGLIA